MFRRELTNTLQYRAALSYVRGANLVKFAWRLILPTSIGTRGRNTIREPGKFNGDLSISRRISLTENIGFQLRGEAFNVLDRTNFNGPSSALNVTVNAAGSPFFDSPGFGLVTPAKSARSIQLVARFEF